MEYRLKDIYWYKTRNGFVPYIVSSKSNKFKLLLTQEVCEFSDLEDMLNKMEKLIGIAGEVAVSNYGVIFSYYRRVDPISIVRSRVIMFRKEFHTTIVDEKQIEKITNNINKNFIKLNKKTNTETKQEKLQQKLEIIAETSRDF